MSDPEDDEALRLNTLHRFRKHSPRLLLQEYSHCEVPAGCGGVVLRWIDRAGGLPVLIRSLALGSIRAWVDGQALVGSRSELGPGNHALAFELSELPRPNTPMLAEVVVNLPDDHEVVVGSGANDRWWMTAHAPSGAWTEPGYDAQAQGWTRAISHPNWEPEVPENQRWRWSSMARSARAIALPGAAIWLRCEFEVAVDAIARRFADAEERGRG